MLPAIVLTVAYVLVNVGSSPVYNMQPAYITANIGTTGRNIRNLPCISRKNSLSGVCMFAIDCFKANGTHLGTCIDRFYFGSCCHIEPVSNEIDNNIEPALFPDKHREPPLRLSGTEENLRSTTSTEKVTLATTTPAIISTSISSSSTIVASTFQELKSPSTTNIPTTTSTSTSKPTTKATKAPITTTITTTTTTRKSLSTTTPPTTWTTTPATTSVTKTTTRTTTVPTTIKTETTSRTPIILIKEPTTDLNEAYKLTTFQSVDNEIQTTLKPTVLFSKPSSIGSTIYKITKKPTSQLSTITEDIKEPITVSVPLVTRTPSSPKTTAKPINTKLTQKPINKPSSRPTKPTGKPTRTKPSRPTQKPLTRPTSKPTRRVTTTSKPSKPTRPNTKISTTVVFLQPSTTTEKVTTTKFEQGTKETPTVSTTTSKQALIESKPFQTETPLIDKVETPSTNVSHSSLSTSQITSSTSVTSEFPSSPTTSSTSSSTTTTSTTTQPTLPTTVTQQIPVLLTTENPMGLFPMEEGMKVPEMATTTESNDVLNMNLSSIFAESVNGNTATNEIESVKPLVEPTTRPSLVTWTGAFEEPNINGTDGDWVPITTPDGWVMLPSVSSANEPSSSPSSSTSTSGPPIIQGGPTLSTDRPTSSTIAPQETTSVIYNVSSSSTLDGASITTDSTVEAVEEPAFNMSDFRDVCGRRIYPEARIVGGDNSTFGKWPWQISLRQWRTSTYLHKCGAALLSEYWAITAAHCVERVPPSDLLLRLGEYDLANELEPYVHQERRVQIVASHPQFDPRTFEYDLALLRFYEPVKFQPNILPVCVPQNDDDFIGTNAYVTGWGRLYEDGPLPNILQEVRVPVINNTLCESMYRSAGYIEHIPHIFICAGWGRGGYDSCEGDSGGPMVIQREDKRFLLAGVISWGIGCAEPNQPGVYTRISEFRDWINQILQF